MSERERVCVCERERKKRVCMCERESVCVCVRERECVCEVESERDVYPSECIWIMGFQKKSFLLRYFHKIQNLGLPSSHGKKVDWKEKTNFELIMTDFCQICYSINLSKIF